MVPPVRKNVAVRVWQMLGQMRGRVLLVGLWLPVMAAAVEVERMYEIEIPAENQQAETRRAGFSVALQGVLIKVSGNRAIADTPAGKAVLADAPRYVLQYRYRFASGGESEHALYLWVEFDRSAIEQALKLQGLSVWDNNRPVTLVWLGVEEGFGRRMLAETDRDIVRQQIEKVAARRGLPLLFPWMDTEDQSKVSFADIRGDFSEQILEASARYAADIVVTAALLRRPNSDVWESQWTIYREGTSSKWDAQGTLAAVVAAGIESVGDILASRYSGASRQPGQRQDVILEVSNLQNFRSYSATLHQLRSISQVVSAQPLWVHDDRVRFKLSVQGDLRNLERGIMLGRILLPEEQAVSDLSVAAMEKVNLVFRYAK